MGRIGVLRSIDGGRSWSPSNVGLPTLATNAIAVTDTATGAVWVRNNAAGQLASYADISAF